MSSIKQKIVQKEAELARLKDKERKLENGQKIIIGGMMLSMAKDNPQVAVKLLQWIDEHIERKADLDRLDDLIQRLQETAKHANISPSQNIG